MSNQEKDSLLNMISFTKKIDASIDVNTFFDESFVDYLINESNMLIGQLSIALKCFNYDSLFTNDHLTTRDKKLLGLLLNMGVNINSIMSKLNETCYNDFKQYVKQLYEAGYIKGIKVIFTNNIGFISDITGSLDLKVVDLVNCLINRDININVKKYLLSIGNNRETLINKVNVNMFYDIITKLNLDESFKQERIDKLNCSLNNPNISMTDLKEVISELIAQDNYHNFMLNLELICNYLQSEKNVPSVLVDLYNSLVYVTDIVNDGVIDHTKIDLISETYELIGMNYKRALQLIRENFNANLNRELQSGDIYLVHTEPIEDITANGNIKENYQRKINHPSGRISFSLLNKERTGTYGGKKTSVIFGYNQTPTDNLECAALGDARTAQSRIWTRSSFLAIDDYLEQTIPDHNELLYGGIKEFVKPDYILSFYEEATEIEQQVADVFNIPVRYLKENVREGFYSYYPDKEYVYESYKEIQYITNYMELGKTM